MKIFIQIASYRDKELIPSIVDALAKANHPENLSFGVAWQASLAEGYQESDMIQLGLGDRLRVITIPWTQAKGVGYARLLCQKLWQGESFTLQIDAHCRFVQGWDAKLIEMWQFLRLQSRKPLITYYAPSYLPPDRLDWWVNPVTEAEEPIQPNVSRLGCTDDPTGQQIGRSRDSNGLLSFPPAYENTFHWKILRPFGGDSLVGAATPALGMFISGHFIFTVGEFCQKVPYDPEIYFIGEEISLSVRAWTSGYDIYYPNSAIAYHYYTRNGRERHWDNHSDYAQQEQISIERTLSLLGIERQQLDLSPYGLGNVRSLQSYERFAGVNFKEAKFNDLARLGIPTQPEIIPAEFHQLTV